MIVVFCLIYSFVVKTCYMYLDLEVMFFNNNTLQIFAACLLCVFLTCIYIYVYIIVEFGLE